MKKSLKLLTGLVAFVSLLTMGIIPALAAEKAPVDIELGPPSGWTGLSFEIPQLITALIRIILVVAALVAFVFLIVGGIKWITSGGDKEQTAKAQSTITAALVGLVIVFAAWAIIKLIEAFFGIDILKLTIEPIGGG